MEGLKLFPKAGNYFLHQFCLSPCFGVTAVSPVRFELETPGSGALMVVAQLRSAHQCGVLGKVVQIHNQLFVALPPCHQNPLGHRDMFRCPLLGRGSPAPAAGGGRCSCSKPRWGLPRACSLCVPWRSGR